MSADKTAWHLIEHPGGGWTIQDRHAGGGLCIAQKYGDSPLENGRLIAAAPDLLSALKGLMLIADVNTLQFDAARAAVAKGTNPNV